MWIARDKNGNLFLYLECKPTRDENEWRVPFYNEVYQLDKNLYPDVRWEDLEPTALVPIQDRHSLIDALGDILIHYLHGGEVDEVIAEFEDYLNKSNYENTTEDSDIAL